MSLLKRDLLIAELNERLRMLADPDEIMAAACEVIGRAYGASRAGFAEVLDADAHVRIRHEYLDGAPPIAAVYHLSAGRAAAFFGTTQPVLVDDVEASPALRPFLLQFRAAGTRAFVALPLLRDGERVAWVFVADRETRHWEPASVALLEQAVQRAWSSAERARTVLLLRASEERLRLAIVGGRLGTWWLELPGFVINWSEGRAELFGLPPDRTSLTHEEWRRLVHPEDRARAEAALFDCAEGRSESYQAEYRVTWPDGSEHILASSGTLMRNEAGRPAGIAGVVQDVTRRRRIEAELRRLTGELERRVEERTSALALSEARYRAYWENTAEHLFSLELTPDGTLVVEAVNPRLERVLGTASATLAGSPAEAVLPGEDSELLEANCRRCLESDAAVAFEATVRLPDGMHWWETVVAPVHDGAIGRVTRVLGSARDVTARRLAEQQLRQAQKMEAIGQLTGGIAHDFNNLLTAIAGALELLGKRVGNDERGRRLIDSAMGATERGAKLVAQLLAFSRQQRLDPAPLDLNEVVTAMQSLLRSTLGGRVEIGLALEPSLWTAWADRTQIELVLLNLGINARDAMEEGGSIILGTANVVRGEPERPEEPPPGRYAALTVTDHGHGMTPSVRARIFDPFFTTKPIGKGTGLGLPQVLGVAHQLGGGVEVKTAPEAGTAVTVFLPLAEAMLEALPPASPAGEFAYSAGAPAGGG